MDEDMSPSSPDLSCGRAYATTAGRRGSYPRSELGILGGGRLSSRVIVMRLPSWSGLTVGPGV